jgi:prevent-host-death family protein
MDIFTIRDLRERTGDLVRDAKAGRLSVVTKHSRPLFVAVPFDEALIKQGVNVSLAATLYNEGVLTLTRAARLAQLSVEAFIEKLGAMGVTVVDYSAEELEHELSVIG